jgi:shikimate kinase
MKKIFLIGYMGSGKTTIGKLLAKKMGLQFIDVDVFIENRYRKTISAIFEERGEEGFRKIERQALSEIIEFENSVISTGGGLPCFFDNMELMNKAGITIYLKTSVEELLKRLGSGKQNRPLIKGKSPEELKIFIATNLNKREVCYNKAIITFEFDDNFTGKNVDGVVNQIICEISDR